MAKNTKMYKKNNGEKKEVKNKKEEKKEAAKKMSKKKEVQKKEHNMSDSDSDSSVVTEIGRTRDAVVFNSSSAHSRTVI